MPVMLRAHFGLTQEELCDKTTINKEKSYYSSNEACSNFYEKYVASDLKIDTILVHDAKDSIDSIRLVFTDGTKSPILGNHNKAPNI